MLRDDGGGGFGRRDGQAEVAGEVVQRAARQDAERFVAFALDEGGGDGADGAIAAGGDNGVGGGVRGGLLRRVPQLAGAHGADVRGHAGLLEDRAQAPPPAGPCPRGWSRRWGSSVRLRASVPSANVRERREMPQGMIAWMEPRISLITLGVSDLERSLRFYRDGLGLPTTWTVEKGVIFFQTSGTTLALYPHDALAKDVSDDFVMPKPALHRNRAAHNVRTKGEVDQVLQQARAPPAGRSRSRGRTRSGADTAAIFRIPTGTCGRWRGGRFRFARMGRWRSRDGAHAPRPTAPHAPPRARAARDGGARQSLTT